MKGLLLFAGLILTATVSIAYGLSLLDSLVHGTLYNYGLQFSFDWAAPYWTVLRVIQVFLGLIVASTLASTVYVYRKYVQVRPQVKKTAERTVEKETIVRSTVPEPLRSVSGLIRCAHCGKVFSQPLRMLDFHADRPRMINICPFCSEVIGPVLQQEESERVKRAVQKEKKDNHSKVVRGAQGATQDQSKGEAEETVAVQA